MSECYWCEGVQFEGAHCERCGSLAGSRPIAPAKTLPVAPVTRKADPYSLARKEILRMAYERLGALNEDNTPILLLDSKDEADVLRYIVAQMQAIQGSFGEWALRVAWALGKFEQYQICGWDHYRTRDLLYRDKTSPYAFNPDLEPQARHSKV